jgi:uncharacterized protein (DUF1810 family)
MTACHHLRMSTTGTSNGASNGKSRSTSPAVGPAADADAAAADPTADAFDLQRFVIAQHRVYGQVLAELAAGHKRSHWMWFIFPQLRGLGRSETARHYGIVSLAEAQAYLAHPLLGARLRACVALLGRWAGQRSAEAMLGPVDALKLRSCLTLFDAADRADEHAPGAARAAASQPSAFAALLQALFPGGPDEATLALLKAAKGDPAR